MKLPFWILNLIGLISVSSRLWQVKLLGAALIFGTLFLYHTYEVDKAVDKALSQQIKIHDDQVAELKIQSIRVESDLKNQIDSIKGEKDAKIKDIDTKYRATIASLRQRTERSTASDSTRDTCDRESTQGATGAELYREDAEILIGFARDTEKLKEYLNTCYAQYDQIKETLDKFSNTK
jgi:hypothetical protein